MMSFFSFALPLHTHSFVSFSLRRGGLLKMAAWVGLLEGGALHD